MMRQIIYIVTAGNQSIEVWKLLNTGEMILIQILNTDNLEGQPITILKKRNKLYLGVRPQHKILIYDICIDGRLKKIGSIDVPYSLNYLTTDSTENILLCSYYHGNCISVSNIHTDHMPQMPNYFVNNIYGCHYIHINKNNKNICTTALLSDRIYLYQIKKNNNDIFLKKIHYIQCKKKSGPRHMDFDSTGKYAYSINEINGTIDVWKIYHNPYIIKNIQNISLFKTNKKGTFWSADIHITSCNNYLYASDRLHNTISIFKIDSHGKLCFVNQQHTADEPKSFAIDQNNEYLISISRMSSVVSVYNISIQNGLLNQLYEYKVGKNPTWVLIHTL